MYSKIGWTHRQISEVDFFFAAATLDFMHRHAFVATATLEFMHRHVEPSRLCRKSSEYWLSRRLPSGNCAVGARHGPVALEDSEQFRARFLEERGEVQDVAATSAAKCSRFATEECGATMLTCIAHGSQC